MTTVLVWCWWRGYVNGWVQSSEWRPRRAMHLGSIGHSTMHVQPDLERLSYSLVSMLIHLVWYQHKQISHKIPSWFSLTGLEHEPQGYFQLGSPGFIKGSNSQRIGVKFGDTGGEVMWSVHRPAHESQLVQTWNLKNWRKGTTRSGACSLIWLNTGKLTRSRHSKDWHIESSFLILWPTMGGAWLFLVGGVICLWFSGDGLQHVLDQWEEKDHAS